MPKIPNESKCAWCGLLISQSSGCVGLNAKKRPGADISPVVGTIQNIYLKKIKKTVPVIFVTKDSEAKKEGWDMSFMLCSQKCCNKLAKAILNDNKYIVN